MKIVKGHYVPKELITSEAVHEAVVKCFVAVGVTDDRPEYGDYEQIGGTGLCVSVSGRFIWGGTISCVTPLTLQQLFTAENGLQWPDWAESIVGGDRFVYFKGDGHLQTISGDFKSLPFGGDVLAIRQPKEKEVKSDYLDVTVVQFGGVWPEFNWSESKKNKHAIVRTVKQWVDDVDGVIYREGYIRKGGTSLDSEFCELVCTKEQFERRAKELGYINGYRWGIEYPTNGKRPDLPDDVRVELRYSKEGIWFDKTVADSRWLVGGVVSFRITDPRYKPADTSYLNASTQSQSLTHGEEGLTHSEWWDYENDQPVSRPPIGVEVLLPPKFDEKSKAVVVGHFNVDTVLYSNRADSYFGVPLDGNKMRPLDHAARKAELERKALIEQAAALVDAPNKHSVAFTIEQLIDAGWRPTK